MFTLSALTLFAAISNLLLGFLVLSRGSRKGLNVSFFIFTVVDSIWAFTNYYFEVIHKDLFVFKSQYSAGGLVLISAVVWIIFLLEGKQKNIRILIVAFLGLVIGAVPFVDNLVVSHIFEQPDGTFQFDTGPLFNYYAATLLAVLIYLLVRLTIAVRRESGVKKVQLRYVLVGISFFAAVSITFGLILPLFHIKPIVAFDAQSSLIWVAFTAFAIVRHRLLDITIIIKRATVFLVILTSLGGLVFLFAMQVPTVLANLSPDIFSRRGVQDTFRLVVPFLLALMFPAIRRTLEEVTDRWFFKRPYNPEELMDHLAQTISSIINLPHLVDATTQIMTDAFKVRRAFFFVREDPSTSSGLFRIRNTVAYPFDDDKVLKGHDPMIVYWDRYPNETLLADELRQSVDEKKRGVKEIAPVVKEMDKFKVAVGVPILSKDRLVGALLLGEKKSGDVYSNQDIRILELFSHQVGVAIENAKLFEEQKNFAEKLKLEVERATQDLQVSNVALAERNRNLSSLQKITNTITRTFNMSRVTQTIVDSIAGELGYLGGGILLLGDDRRSVHIRAITNTPLLARAEALLKQKLLSFKGDLNEEGNLSLRAIRTGQMQMSPKLAEFTAPYIAGPLATALQKLAGIKTMVALPIYAENEIIGALDVALTKGKGEIREEEVNMMKSLADQTGIIIRNLRLYEEVRAYSERLEKINEYLKQLDATKTEFISIASHQLRSPLTGIKGYLSMILQGDFGPITPQQHKIMHDLFEHTEHLVRLINLFLNVSRIEAGRFTIERIKASIEKLVENVIAELSPQANAKKITLTLKKPAKPVPELWIDADKIRDVLENYIDNAIKYTPKGSVIVTIDLAGVNVVVSVRDTGIGIPHDEQLRLFDKFARARGIAQMHPEGTGLGLYIAKKIVQAHGGKVWVESLGAGKGSAFFFSLPTS